MARYGVHTRLDYRPVPPKEVLPVFFVGWFDLIHKPYYIFVDDKSGIVSTRHHARRISQSDQGSMYVLSERIVSYRCRRLDLVCSRCLLKV